jgi:hypothetical protein
MIDPKLDELEEQEWCYYSDLPSPMAYMKSTNSNTDSGTLDKSSSIDNNKDKKDDSSTLS